MKERLLLIKNPVSGMALGKVPIETIAQILSRKYDVFIHITTAKEDACTTVKRYGSAFDVLAVSGGDGTINEVLQAVMTLPENERPKLGIIPAGTSNLLADVVKIPPNMEIAAEIICDGVLHGLDVGMMGGYSFATAISFGCFTDTTYATPQTLKNIFGYTAYVIGAVKSLSELRSYNMTVTIGEGEEVIGGDYLLGAVTNVNSVGAIIKLDPSIVDYNDGKFEAVFIRRPENIAELSNIVAQIFSGKLDNDLIRFFQTDRVSIRINEEIPWTVDGEYIKDFGSVDITMYHSALEVFTLSNVMRERYGSAIYAPMPINN
ncbi:MAG: YegS/Rv2252/BmrU family lipid kinase [Eubacteriaceae bacterium]|nr:YegS/Rv2252/BmrU family lipid kinase [Eubacteriaceae bacterium]